MRRSSTQWSHYANWAALLLLLIFFFTRLHNLLALPVFIDEASHITRAQYVWQDKPLYLLETGKALAPYLMALFWPFQGQIFIGRIVVVLLGLIGLAACYSVGKALYSRQAGLLAMLFWILSTQLFFFERMALVDTTLSAMAMLTVWLGIRAFRSGYLKYAILLGIGLTLTILAKLTGIVFLPIPILVALFIRSRIRWTTRFKLAIVAYVVTLILLLPVALYIRGTGEDPTGVKYGLTSTDVNSLGKRLQTNSAKVLDAERTYFTDPVLLAIVVGIFAALIFVPRAFFVLLPLSAALLLAVIAAGVSLWLRYGSPAVPFLLVLAAIGFVATAERLREARVPGIIAVLPWLFAAVWAITIYLPFQNLAYTDPGQLPLPQGDRSEYIEWIPSGFGIQEATDYLKQNITEPTTVIVTAANCDGARMYIPYNSPLTLVCPGVDWGGRNMNIINDMRTRVEREGKLYVLGEEANIVRERDLPEPYTVLARYSRPNDADYYAVKIYLLESAATPDPNP